MEPPLLGSKLPIRSLSPPLEAAKGTKASCTGMVRQVDQSRSMDDKWGTGQMATMRGHTEP